MLTEEDFEKAEEAIRHIDVDRHCVGISQNERELYNFAKKVLAEARRDFLTDKKVVISKMEIVQTIPKITPMK